MGSPGSIPLSFSAFGCSSGLLREDVSRLSSSTKVIRDASSSFPLVRSTGDSLRLLHSRPCREHRASGAVEPLDGRRDMRENPFELQSARWTADSSLASSARHLHGRSHCAGHCLSISANLFIYWCCNHIRSIYGCHRSDHITET